MIGATKRKKLLYVVSEDWYFCSHRISHAIVAMDAGFDVVLATRIDRHADKIRRAGIKLIPINLVRSSLNPFKELLSIHELVKIYRTEKPDVVHHVAIKPVLYGSIAAWLTGVRGVVNLMAGLGHVFVANSLKARLIRSFVKTAFRFFFNQSNTIVIVQNHDDLQVMEQELHVSSSNLKLIRGSGVDMEAFAAKSFPETIPLVILPARLLWEKGVGEFVQAASILIKKGIKARFALVGEADYENPAGVSRKHLESWQDSIECWGRREDMPHVYSECHVVCLPSYREGLPKVLLEAASSGRAIVTTDVPGCREVVVDGVNGLLVPVRDAVRLAAALESLILNPEHAMAMGAAGRRMVAQEFTVQQVAAETLNIYEKLLN